MTIADDCRKWAVVMYRAATSIEEDQDLSKTPDIVCVIDSHRALADTISKAADEIDRLNRERDAAVCEGATIGHMSATADAQERERRLREAVGSLLNWVETISKRTPYEMPRSERDAFRELIGAVPKEGE